MKDKDSFVFRLIVETDSSLKIRTVTLVQLGKANNIINSWPIELTKITNVAPLKDLSIKLPKPHISVKKPKDSKIGNSADE